MMGRGEGERREGMRGRERQNDYHEERARLNFDQISPEKCQGGDGHSRRDRQQSHRNWSPTGTHQEPTYVHREREEGVKRKISYQLLPGIFLRIAHAHV